jgi:hypothetical protein
MIQASPQKSNTKHKQQKIPQAQRIASQPDIQQKKL